MDDFDRLAVDMNNAGDRIGRQVYDLVRAATLRTEALGKTKAPVRTGALRSSISSDIHGSPRSVTIRGETGPTVDYARFVEHGTSRMAPQPYMGPAADVVEPWFFAAAEALAGDGGGVDG